MKINSTRVGMVVLMAILLTLSFNMAYAINKSVNATESMNCSNIRNCVESCTEIQNCSAYLSCTENCTVLQSEANAVNATSAGCEHFGVPLSPSIYLLNFLLLYFTNPEIGANMPAYRAAIPLEVYKCLAENPEGCPYADMAQYFSEQALQSGGSQNNNNSWPSYCRTDPKWQALAPPEYPQPDQINQPLGREKADQLAQDLGISQDMILTDEEYECMIGKPPRGPAREIIFVCTNDLTNSKGNAAIPLSSYGLSLNAQGDIRTNCAPDAPCLVFNQLAKGPLEVIAKECGFADKLKRLVNETPFMEFVNETPACQQTTAPSCIAEATCPCNGGQSNNSCAARPLS
jgi:hypothetical protein